MAVQYFKKFISSYYKNYLDKLTATLTAINILLQIAKLTVKFTKLAKQKYEQLANSTNK